MATPQNRLKDLSPQAKLARKQHNRAGSSNFKWCPITKTFLVKAAKANHCHIKTSKKEEDKWNLSSSFFFVMMARESSIYCLKSRFQTKIDMLIVVKLYLTGILNPGMAFMYMICNSLHCVSRF